MSLLERLYRTALVALPIHVRRQFGPSMVQTFTTGLRCERETRGTLAAVMWAVRDSLDVVLIGLRQRLGSAAGGTIGSPLPRTRLAALRRLLSDAGHAVRMLRRAPGYSAVVIVTIVLAVGANAAVFAVVDAVLLRPSPFPNSGELVQIHHAIDDGFALFARMGPDRLRTWSDQSDVFQRVEGYETESFVLAGEGEEEPERIMAAFVSTGLLPMLGVPAQLGTSSVTDAEAEGTIVLSRKLWARRFGSDPEIVGRTISLSDDRYTVVGVMPGRFVFPYAAVEAWLPVPMTEAGMQPAGGGLQPLARLTPTISLEVAQERVDIVSEGLEETLPREDGWHTRLRPLDERFGSDSSTRRALLVLLGAVGLVLLIACANIANLTLSAITGRRREMAVRSALGASRWQLTQLLLMQSVVLCTVGGALALALAHWAVPAVVGLADDNFTFFSDATIAVDGRVAVAVLVLSMITAVLSTLGPALRFSRKSPLADLREGGRSLSPTRVQRTVRGTLVVTQVGLSLMLLIGAGLLGKSFLRLAAVPLGFETDNTIAFSLELDGDRYPSNDAQHAFYQQLVQSLSAVPGVSDVTIASGLPPGGSGIAFSIEPEAQGEPPAPKIPDLVLPFTNAANNYFEFFGVPLLQGRGFADADRNRSVVIVNEAVARHYWGSESPVGRQFRLEPDAEWMTVIGVAADIKIDGPEDRFGAMEIYYPLAQQHSMRYREIAVRVTEAPGEVMAGIKSAVWSLDSRLPILNLSTLDERLADSIARPRFYALLMAGFAVFGVVVAAVGLYGVISYSVAQRTREIGIRMALGARGGVVLRSVIRGGIGLTGIGVVLGLTGAMAVTRVLESLLFEVEATDPVVFAGLVALVFSLSVVATALPARRASSVDPNIALRAE